MSSDPTQPEAGALEENRILALGFLVLIILSLGSCIALVSGDNCRGANLKRCKYECSRVIMSSGLQKECVDLCVIDQCGQ
jgi:hypothetical protein